MKKLSMSLVTTAACLGLASGARSTDFRIAPVIPYVDGCGTVVFDEICGTLFQMDSGQHFAFSGLEDFQVGNSIFIAGVYCQFCLLTPCGSEWSAIMNPSITPCFDGDLNFDRVVNTLDLGVMLTNWSIPATQPGCGGAKGTCYSDLDGDGFVNSLDLGMLLANWTF